MAFRLNPDSEPSREYVISSNGVTIQNVRIRQVNLPINARIGVKDAFVTRDAKTGKRVVHGSLKFMTEQGREKVLFTPKADTQKTAAVITPIDITRRVKRNVLPVQFFNVHAMGYPSHESLSARARLDYHLRPLRRMKNAA